MLLESFLEVIRKMNLDAYINPITDEHFNELIGPSDQRVQELTGFKGTYGTAITGISNAFFTSYQFLDKAKSEVKNYEVIDESSDAMRNWITSKGIKRIGICSKLVPTKYFKKLYSEFKAAGAQLISFDEDLFDTVWKTRPKKIFNTIFNLQDYKLSKFIDPNYIKQFVEFKVSDKKKYNLNTIIPGRRYNKKIKKLQRNLKKDEGFVISNLATIAWLTNLRGSDLKYSGLFYSFAYLTKKKFTLFLGNQINLKGITIKKYEEFYDFLKEIKEKKVYISDNTNLYIYSLLKNPEYSDLVERAEYQTNQIETFGFKMSGVADAISMIQLFTWLENSDKDHTEIEIKDKLLALKSKHTGYYSESFEPLIASGINSSKIYHEATDKIHTKDEILLIDAGSHYMYGTTDITRTVCLGKPSPDMIRFYTITLKSLIRAKYIKKSAIKGKELDEALRYNFIKIGKDFITSSGHGVGFFSYVHESFPKLSYEDDVLALKNVFTLEPFYRDSNLGIRLEDLVLLNKKNGFVLQTNLSFVPYQHNLIDNNMLTEVERKQVNLYSRKMREFLSPLFKENTKEYAFLMKNTEELPFVEQTKDVTGNIYNVNSSVQK